MNKIVKKTMKIALRISPKKISMNYSKPKIRVESSECIESGEIKASSDREEKNFLKVYRSKRRMHVPSGSDSEDEKTRIPCRSQNVIGGIEITLGGKW
ncbi:hypothetical protein KM043_007919 [Ampulex compressa]|nr:hypothetical protein KM043_007919 [Ampulex compressa]